MNTLAPLLTRRKLTVSEYYRMAEAGILDEDDRIELIDGEILDMAPIGADHINAVNDLTRALVIAIGDHGVVSVQNPLRLDIHNEPMPDFVVFRPRPDSERKTRHTPADVLLVVEVAKTSLRYDNKVKLPKYAAAGIPEVWIIDVARHRLHIHRDPEGDVYKTTRIVTAKETVALAKVPDASIPLARILAP